jgi:HD superfamily phosphohydrolase
MEYYSKIVFYMKKWLLFPLICFFSGCSEQLQNNESILGTINLSDPVLLKIHDSKIIQRLKNIDQSGTPAYYCQLPSFSRYDHSIGVLYLVQHFGGDIKEQLAALTHDASHTVFSHVADKFFDIEGYQDKIHEETLTYLGAQKILDEYGLKIHDINPEHENFKRQEQPLPDMCADRIEYNIHTGLIFNLITKDDVKEILDHLFYQNEKWYFDSVDAAQKFATLSLIFTEHFWGSAENARAYYLTTKILKKSFTLNLFNMNEFHYENDNTIINKIEKTSDDEIKFYMSELKKINMKKIGQFTMPAYPLNKSISVFIKPKFRGIDPLVLKKDKFVRLTTLSKSFKNKYDRVKKKMNNGFNVKMPIYSK